MAARLNDFFVSRRGSVSAVAQEVAGILRDSGYAVLVQDYDFPHGGDFVDTLHAAIKNSRDLIVLLSRDYEESYWTRKELASFIADIGQGVQERRVIVLRCEDVPARGLLAPLVYQDLVGITDPEERKRRILDAAEGRSVAASPPPRPFIGVPPRIVSFVGRAAALDRIDLILTGGSKPAAITQASVGRVAVQGMGGIGKTSLAIEYAHRFRDLYAGVWWCPSETRTGLLTCLAMLGVALEAVPRTEADIDKAAQAALRLPLKRSAIPPERYRYRARRRDALPARRCRCRSRGPKCELFDLPRLKPRDAHRASHEPHWHWPHDRTGSLCILPPPDPTTGSYRRGAR
jgi:hypothetical protein